MSTDVRCLQCNKKLAEVRNILEEPIYDAKGAEVIFRDGLLYQVCGKCGAEYQVKRQGPGWALIGEMGSKIFEEG
jgi:uncharacterized protein with PIN domain